MPVKVKDGLPALSILREENIFVMAEQEALHQDIRELKILLCNLMPNKERTETQFLRLLSNSPLQITVDLLRFDSHTPKNTPKEHMEAFYVSFDEVSERHYDGLIITGAPVANLPFEAVTYWDDVVRLNAWAQENVISTLYLCWAAWAGLHLNHGVEKVRLERKLFGVFPHRVRDRRVPIVRGFDDVFMAPHSRENGLREEDLAHHPELVVAADSTPGGPYVVVCHEDRAGQDPRVGHCNKIYITGHSEYDPHCLKNEYERDVHKGLDIHVPENYFLGDNPATEPVVQWRGHANMLFTNWLNYYVYQVAPFDWTQT